MRKIKGFTLVELLVVIGIIAILISLLLPALNRVRWQANVTACAARLHDLAAATIMYADGNKGWLPPYAWDNGQASFNIDPNSPSMFNGIWQVWENSSKWGNGWNLGRLYTSGYLKTNKTLFCPAANSPPNPDKDFRHGSYYFFNPHIAYNDDTFAITQIWWKKISGYGRVMANQEFRKNDGSKTTSVPTFRRALITDSMFAYGSASNSGDVAHLLGSSRAYNLAYADGSVQSYVAPHRASRVTDRWWRYLDISNTVQYAADGGVVNWNGSWENRLNVIPIAPPGR